MSATRPYGSASGMRHDDSSTRNAPPTTSSVTMASTLAAVNDAAIPLAAQVEGQASEYAEHRERHGDHGIEVAERGRIEHVGERRAERGADRHEQHGRGDHRRQPEHGPRAQRLQPRQAVDARRGGMAASSASAPPTSRQSSCRRHRCRATSRGWPSRSTERNSARPAPAPRMRAVMASGAGARVRPNATTTSPARRPAASRNRSRLHADHFAAAVRARLAASGRACVRLGPTERRRQAQRGIGGGTGAHRDGSADEATVAPEA